ncbi:MFS transporter [Streptomyces johnsoniae]|uniref:MFS transporter n=1 Tax=Streptomyces johnsoniae TaxID=3075532 RepID=A0ABU2S9T7_9ACTN|nr:MFS transporter [Streptomyces sp. DSM 41886]MDT0444584.1 MFS transporter [Streptomyces sp. DSM 41886]
MAPDPRLPRPVVAALFAAGTRLIPRDGPRRHRAPGRPDVPGALLLTAAIAALIGALSHVPAEGWAGRRGTALLLLCAVSSGLLVLRERTAARPLWPAHVLRSPGLVRAALVAAALNGAHPGALLTASLHLQTQRDLGPLPTALAFLPAAAPLALCALHSGRMVERFGPRRLIACGLTSALAGFALLWQQGLDGPYPTGLLPALLAVGAGFVLAFAALNTQATAGVPDRDKARAGAAYQTAVQIGAALTVACTAALLPTAPTGPLPGRAPALTAVLAVAALGWLAAVVGTPRRRGATPSRPGRTARPAAVPGLPQPLLAGEDESDAAEPHIVRGPPARPHPRGTAGPRRRPRPAGRSCRAHRPPGSTPGPRAAACSTRARKRAGTPTPTECGRTG